MKLMNNTELNTGVATTANTRKASLCPSSLPSIMRNPSLSTLQEK